jgi:hypothetical protein
VTPDDRWRIWIAPALLVVVALTQIWRVHELDQSSWSGAGFGMFATIDSETFRPVRGWVVDDEGSRPVALPAELERAAFELQVVPTEDRARALAERWRDLVAKGRGRFVVEVWRLQFDSSSTHLNVETLRRVEIAE